MLHGQLLFLLLVALVHHQRDATEPTSKRAVHEARLPPAQLAGGEHQCSSTTVLPASACSSIHVSATQHNLPPAVRFTARDKR